ncbi:SET domain-containing protein-lysine N-methyltransferase [Candidatus Parcubacteria bacterium]|nr:SET domain-containing protein-lysine N-methyltransferase [Candidatus Parcubacteria bacterium]
MLMVKTRLGPSKIHGIGLFADQFIPKGALTWRFVPGFDLKIEPDELLRLSEPARKLFWQYAYVDKNNGHYILCFDDERFINHSEEPNIIQKRIGREVEGREVASRDIQPGEELTVNYYDFDKDAERKLKNLGVYGGFYD